MKNAFELRYDLIALAHDHLESQFNANVKFAQAMIESAIASGKEVAAAMADFMPKYPTVEDVLKEAKKFYNFVDTSK